nr:MAG TPA: hypothetical protein [Caudoviricetes sp.]DAP87547.1 MAG TPA: hypothetical protein [Caudoviricetes sp.]
MLLRYCSNVSRITYRNVIRPALRPTQPRLG